MRTKRTWRGKAVQLAFLSLLGFLLALSVSSQISFAAPNKPELGSIKVMKSIPSVSPDNRLTFILTIENNGTVPVFDLEVFEYLNTNLQFGGTVVINQPSGQSKQVLSSAGLATAAQIIIDPPSPAMLEPGQKMTIQYTMYSPKSGDFLIPTALTWFSYKLGNSTIRSNLYSNGLMAHVPNAFEKTSLQIFPYVLSGSSFTATFAILLWARGKLAKIRKQALR